MFVRGRACILGERKKSRSNALAKSGELKEGMTHVTWTLYFFCD